MILTDIPTEQTTAATDLVLAAIASVCAWTVGGCRFEDPLRKALWAGVFVLVALAASLGAVVHGLRMSQAVNFVLWQPLNLALALAVALFAAAAVWDLAGRRMAVRFMPFACAAGLVFFVVSWRYPDSFLAFVFYEAGALFFAMAVYFRLAAQGGRPGAGWLTAGLALLIFASAVQPLEFIRFKVFWEFDSNGAFHLLQMPALLLIRAGAVRFAAGRGEAQGARGKVNSWES